MAPSQNHVLLQLHCAGFLLGGTALFSKLIPMSAINIIAYRALFCGLLVLAMSLAMKQQLVFATRKTLLIIFCSCLFCIHWSCYFQAMQVSSVAIGIVSMFTYPVITVFLEPLFSRKRIQFYDLAMGFLVLLGVTFMVPEFDLDNSATAGVMFGMTSAVAVALRNILVSRYLKGTSPLTLMTYHGLIASMILGPFVSVMPYEISLIEWLLLLILAALFTAVPHTQITFGLLHWPAKKVSMIVSLQVVYASIFAWLLLDEALTWRSALGGACILLAAIGESIKQDLKT